MLTQIVAVGDTLGLGDTELLPVEDSDTELLLVTETLVVTVELTVMVAGALGERDSVGL